MSRRRYPHHPRAPCRMSCAIHCEVRKVERRQFREQRVRPTAELRTPMAKFDRRSVAVTATNRRLGDEEGLGTTIRRRAKRGDRATRAARPSATPPISNNSRGGAAVVPKQSAEPIDAFNASGGSSDLVARRDKSVIDLRRSGENRGRDDRARQRGPTATSFAARSPSTSRHGPPVAATWPNPRSKTLRKRGVGARRPSRARLRRIAGQKPRLLRH